MPMDIDYNASIFDVKGALEGYNNVCLGMHYCLFSHHILYDQLLYDICTLSNHHNALLCSTKT